MYHASIVAQYPGLFAALLQEMGFTNIIVGDEMERLQCTDPDGIVLFEINHIQTIVPSSFTHIGIVSDNTNVRNRAAKAVKKLEFIPLQRHGRNRNETTLIGMVRIVSGNKTGLLGIEVSTPKAHR